MSKFLAWALHEVPPGGDVNVRRQFLLEAAGFEASLGLVWGRQHGRLIGPLVKSTSTPSLRLWRKACRPRRVVWIPFPPLKLSRGNRDLNRYSFGFGSCLLG